MTFCLGIIQQMIPLIKFFCTPIKNSNDEQVHRNKTDINKIKIKNVKRNLHLPVTFTLRKHFSGKPISAKGKGEAISQQTTLALSFPHLSHIR